MIFLIFLFAMIADGDGQAWHQHRRQFSNMTITVGHFKQCHHHHDHDHDDGDHHDNDDDGEVSNIRISLREFKKCLGLLDNSSGVKLAAGCGDLEEIKWIWTGRWNIIASSSSTSA